MVENSNFELAKKFNLKYEFEITKETSKTACP